MTDTLTSIERSQRMALIHGKDTKPELLVRSITHRLGYTLRKHKVWLPRQLGNVQPVGNRASAHPGCLCKHPEGFDSQFPIREDWPCTFITPGDWNGRRLLVTMKKELPYLLRYQKSKKKQKALEYDTIKVTIQDAGMPAVEILRHITEHLAGWQATRFPSHMILYKESRDYVHGVVIHRRLNNNQA